MKLKAKSETEGLQGHVGFGANLLVVSRERRNGKEAGTYWVV